MYSLNRAQLIGRLTRDPESRVTPNGASVCSIGIATNETWKDASGQKQERTEFHNVVAWGKLSEIVTQYLKKGALVFIEGRIQTRSWEDQSGVKKYRTEIIAQDLIMLGGKQGGTGSSEGVAYDNAPIPEEPQNRKEPEISLDDIPF